MRVPLYAEIDGTNGRSIDLIAAQCTDAGQDRAACSVSCRRDRDVAGESRRIKPKAADALQVADGSDQVWTISLGSAACGGKIDRLNCRQQNKVVQLPSSDQQVEWPRRDAVDFF